MSERVSASAPQSLVPCARPCHPFLYFLSARALSLLGRGRARPRPPAPSTTSVALLTAIAALPIQIYSRSFMSPLSRAAAAESFKLSLPRRDTDNSNHAVTDEEGGAAAATRVMAAIP